MALLDEQLVEEWVNRRGFFTIRGIKLGIDEIDLLAVSLNLPSPKYWHIEVQISFNPVGYIGGDTNARRRNEEEIAAGVKQWCEKKFTHPRKVQKRQQLAPGAAWEFKLVHGVLRDASELTQMHRLGIETIPYQQVIDDLMEPANAQSSSAASAITDLLRYMQRRN